jgi:hypothetical protein
MTVYERLSRRPIVFRALTGLSIQEFETLYEQTASAIEDYDESRLNQRARQREIGAGSQYTHDARNRLLMGMIGLRQYPTYEVLGFIFDWHKSNICRNLQGVLAVLREQLRDEVEWPDKTHRKQKMEQFMEEFTEVAAIVDATEQPTQRPQDAERQKQYYSGKKKRHTLKTQMVVGPDGEIMDVSETVPGSQHDKKLYDESGVGDQLDEDEAMMGDSGFQGIQKDHKAVLPDKKPKGGELTDAQKKRNHRISQKRIVVENTIAQVKTFRVLYHVYRHAREAYNDLFCIVAALVNRRIRRRPLRTTTA